jgi:hypothetical protein
VDKRAACCIFQKGEERRTKSFLPDPSPDMIAQLKRETQSMNWKTLRPVLLWVCLLLMPIGVALAIPFALANRGLGYSTTYWAALGTYNGVTLGGIAALALRLGVWLVDNAKKSASRNQRLGR